MVRVRLFWRDVDQHSQRPVQGNELTQSNPQDAAKGRRGLDLPIGGPGSGAKQDGETCDVPRLCAKGPDGTGKSPPGDGFTRSSATNVLVGALSRVLPDEPHPNGSYPHW